MISGAAVVDVIVMRFSFSLSTGAVLVAGVDECVCDASFVVVVVVTLVAGDDDDDVFTNEFINKKPKPNNSIAHTTIPIAMNRSFFFNVGFFC